MNLLLMTIPADARELSDFRRRFRAWLAASELPEDVQDETIIAVHEAMATTVEHGHPQDTIAIRASIEDGVIAVDITDGQWEPPDLDEARRLSLIQRLVDDFDIRPDPSGTTIRLRQTL